MSTLNARIGSFLKSYRNQSAAALAILLATSDHLVKSGDWTPIARVIMGVDERMRNRMLQILGVSFSGLHGAKDTSAEFGYKFSAKKDQKITATDKLEEVRALVESKAAIFGAEVDKLLGLDDKAPRVVDLDKAAVNLGIKAFKAGKSLDDILDEIAKAYREAEHKAQEEAKKAA